MHVVTGVIDIEEMVTMNTLPKELLIEFIRL